MQLGFFFTITWWFLFASTYVLLSFQHIWVDRIFFTRLIFPSMEVIYTDDMSLIRFS